MTTGVSSQADDIEQCERPAARRVAVCLSANTSLVSALLACEPLRAVNRLHQQPAYEITMMGASLDPITTGIGIEVTPGATFEDESIYDLVMVVAAYDQPDDYIRPLRSFLRRQARRGVDICGIDYAVMLLAESGLLNGYRATVHWEVLETAIESFPDVDFCDDVFVLDRDRMTCGGHLACSDLFLEVVQRHHGTKTARFVSADLIYGATRPPETRQSNPLSWDPLIRNVHLRHAIDLMQENVETPLSIPQIAQEIGVSARHLQQLSRKYFGETLSNRYLNIRLNAARRMLMYADMPITEIVAATGFNDASTFSRAFRRRFKTTARAYRRAFTTSFSGPVFFGTD